MGLDQRAEGARVSSPEAGWGLRHNQIETAAPHTLSVCWATKGLSAHRHHRASSSPQAPTSMGEASDVVKQGCECLSVSPPL